MVVDEGRCEVDVESTSLFGEEGVVGEVAGGVEVGGLGDEEAVGAGCGAGGGDGEEDVFVD